MVRKRKIKVYLVETKEGGYVAPDLIAAFSRRQAKESALEDADEVLGIWKVPYHFMKCEDIDGAVKYIQAKKDRAIKRSQSKNRIPKGVVYV